MLVNSSIDQAVVCYAPTLVTTNGIWQGDDPLDYSLPLFIVQLTLIVVITRLLVIILRPLHQPRVVSEILGGIILGPSVMGQSKRFADTIFPLRSVMVLETMANLGLLYFLFLVGVEMDFTVIRRTGRKAIFIAVAGMFLPFLVGISFSFMLHKGDIDIKQGTFVLFLGVALSVTAFPVLARILADLKLLNTELGRVAMSSALINDMCGWILLAFSIALAQNDDKVSLGSVWVILSSLAFVGFSILVIRPLVSWMIQRTPEGEPISEFYISIIITGVMISGFITDAIGTHSIFGAFVFGLVIPNGPLGLALIDKLEDFVSGLLLPLFFAISGLKTEIMAIKGAGTWGLLFLVIVLACVGKIAGTVLVALFYKMPFYEGLTLGLLMNTKGLIELIILNVGRDHKVLDDRSFAIMVIGGMVITAIITPSVMTIYKPSRRSAPYTKRTVQASKTDGEFRVCVCVHTPRNVPTIISLLKASTPTWKSPINVYVLHLVELTGRASAMLIVHNSRKPGHPSLNLIQAHSEHIINAFETFEENEENVMVQHLTAISPYSTIHEDVCSLAEEKCVALIIIPFHKQQTVDGNMEAPNPAYRTINQNLLENAPCSVGILVDRGLGGANRLAADHASHHIAVFFFGGPDDREALAYGLRMSENLTVNLTILRFIAGDESVQSAYESCIEGNDIEPGTTTTTTYDNIDIDKERQIDDDCINEFRTRTGNDDSVVYTEKIVNNGDETVAAIRSVDSIHDLFIVGRGQGMMSSVTAGLTAWSECPELGPIGDLLASSDFAATVTVLVIQQYIGKDSRMEILHTPDSPNEHQTILQPQP